MMRIAFDVAGLPVVKGNLRTSRSGHAYYPNRAALSQWSAAIATEARAAMSVPGCHDSRGGCIGHGAPGLLTSAVEVRATFRLPRPAGHFRSDGVRLRPAAPPFPSGHVGDVDKYARATLDALQSVVFSDDAQVVDLVVRKRYAEPGQQPGVAVEISERLP